MKDINGFFVKNNKWILILILFFGVKVLAWVIDIVISKKWLGLNLTETSQIGGTLAGTLGLIIALFAAILTYMAFLVQYEANEQQKKDLKIERFESKFYTMLEIHRQNTSEIQIGKYLKGRNAFISMFEELRFLNSIVEDFFKQPANIKEIKTLNNGKVLSEEAVFNISYLIFFYGIGKDSTKILPNLFDSKYKNLLNNLENEIDKLKREWKKNNKRIVVERKINNCTEEIILKIPYKPFNGNLHVLSNYIRHLFQLVNYVNEQEDTIIEKEKKLKYISMIRTQLSTHEQLIVYYNSLTILGKDWEEKDSHKEYYLLRNIPFPLADFYIKASDKLGGKEFNGRNLAEWDDIEMKLKKIGLQ